MTETQAIDIRSLLRGLRPDKIENDFGLDDGYYFRVSRGNRNFQIKSTKLALRVIEVGLGDNGIGWKTVLKAYSPSEVKTFLLSVKRSHTFQEEFEIALNNQPHSTIRP